MRVTVIVPAYNATTTISECLEALQHQSVPADEYEVIVVDDGSSDGTKEIAARYSVSLLTQVHRGVASARNLGIDRARGEIILFTDADCVPAHDWVEKLMQVFCAPEISGAKGIYRTHQRELIARFVQIEYENKYDKMKKERYIDFVDTYCAAYRKSVFSKDGGFDPTFHRSGEDIEFSYRLAERGHKLVFVPQAIVYHRHVNSIWAYIKRKFYVGYWRVLMYRKHPGKIWKDSHTPQFLKIQVGLALLFFTLFPLTLLRREFLLALAIAILLFLATALPFSFKAWGKDRAVALLSPTLLFLRALVLGTGFMMGLLARILRREGRA